MSEFQKRNIINNLLRLGPLLILFISVLNEIDLNYIKFFSFNFTFILIFYWSLRRSESLGYGYIFLAGLINDVVTGFPIGISSFNYLLICGFAAYLRTITLVVNSASYSILNIFFSIGLNYYNLFVNIFFTFIFYIIFANLFLMYQHKFFKESND